MLKKAHFEDLDVAKVFAGELLWLGLIVLTIVKTCDGYIVVYDGAEKDAQEA